MSGNDTVAVTAIAFEWIKLVLVPLALLGWLWRRRTDTMLDWGLRAAITATYLLWVGLAGAWAYVSVYLRYLLPILFLAAAIASYRRARSAPLVRTPGLKGVLSLAGRALVLVPFVALALLSLTAQTYEGDALSITSPLQGSGYVVVQGGSNVATNYHGATASPQTYAIDVAKVNGIGTRASGLLPHQLDRYSIYGEPVYSPVSGIVVSAVDSLPDEAPPHAAPERPAGNHVAIRKGNTYLFLAHLQQRSVPVEVGDSVRVGQRVGRVGNTGNTSEPHLHLHAVRTEANIGPDRLLGTGEPVPLLIDGRFLTRNEMFSRRAEPGEATSQVTEPHSGSPPALRGSSGGHSQAGVPACCFTTIP